MEELLALLDEPAVKIAIERAILLGESDVLGIDDLPYEIRESATVEAGADRGFVLPAHGVDFEELRRDLLQQALHRVHGNKTGAGKLLGLNRDQVRYWMRKYGIEESERRGAGEA